MDSDGNLSNTQKVAIGLTATAAVAITVITGGTAAPILLGIAASAGIGGGIGYLTNGVDGIVDGIADGVMLGGLGALAGSVISTAIKTTTMAKQGLTIGRNMDKGFANVTRAATINDTAIYGADSAWKPLNSNYYDVIQKTLGTDYANNASLLCNRAFIKSMKAMGAVIYDSGTNGTIGSSIFYDIELAEMIGYSNYVKMY